MDGWVDGWLDGWIAVGIMWFNVLRCPGNILGTIKRWLDGYIDRERETYSIDR